MGIRQTVEKYLVAGLVRLPESWLIRMSGGVQRSVEGKRLDPQLQFLLTLAAKRPGIDQLALADGRQMYRDMADSFGGRPRAVSRTEDRRVAGPHGDIPLRLYVPADLPPGPAPLLVWFHGGGFVIGDIPSYEVPCRYIADQACCMVLSVDYRLAPEHPFPVAIEECLAVWRHVVANPADYGADPARIGVGGDSAGGHLSAVISQQAKLAGDVLPRHQLLVYPVTDLTREWLSHQTYAEGYLLTRDLMKFFMGQFVPVDADRADPRISPLKATDLSGLPPATLVIAGFDPLQDEGRAYGDALAQAGVPVKVLSYDSLTHGFISLTGVVRAADSALAEISAAVRSGLGA